MILKKEYTLIRERCIASDSPEWRDCDMQGRVHFLLRRLRWDRTAIGSSRARLLLVVFLGTATGAERARDVSRCSEEVGFLFRLQE